MCVLLLRVAEKESVNKMSLHNLATVFGPTLLRPSEKDSKIPANPTQPISMGDSWSLEVMAQVTAMTLHYCLTCNVSLQHLVFPCRSRCCSTSCSWRRSPPPTVNDRASCSPRRCRAAPDPAQLTRLSQSLDGVVSRDADITRHRTPAPSDLPSSHQRTLLDIV